MTRAIDVAYLFLKLAAFEEEPDPLSPLRLQKLLYYAQGWHLACHNKPLFADPIQAWAHGPVVSSVYQKFKKFGSGAIPTDLEIPEPQLTRIEGGLVASVWKAYQPFSALRLREMTHCETPWREARGNLSPEAKSARTISLDSMKRYFKNVLAQGKRNGSSQKEED